MTSLAQICLAPLLLLQGWLVRRRTPGLPEAAGPRAGSGGSGEPLRLLIVGDSAAAGVGAANQGTALAGQLVRHLSAAYHVQWELDATTGATTRSALQHFNQRPARDFDIALISLGVNDVTSAVSMARWRRQHADLRALLRRRFQLTALLVFGIPPMSRFPALPQPLRWYLGSRARAFTRALQHDVAGEDGSRYFGLDFTDDVTQMAPDGFHPGPGIYAEWGRRAATAIERMRLDEAACACAKVATRR